MERLTVTPFGGRRIGITEIQAIAALEREDLTSGEPCDKWAILRDLNVARAAFNVGDRDLVVLNALLSFHPTTELGLNDQLVVFPSNRKLAERAHGMAESTLRRHLGALVRAGLIHRHDSPNGKRYVRRGQGGEIAIAFGFDLTPLVAMAGNIAETADEMRAAALRLQLLRERVSLKLRDAAKLLELAMDVAPVDDSDITTLADIRRAVRRKSSPEELQQAETHLKTLTRRLTEGLTAVQTREVSVTDSQTERHQHNSKPETYDIEPSLEKAEGETVSPTIPLALVIKACPEISLYASDEVRSWRDLLAAAAFVRGMLGISEDAWLDACETMGRDVAAIVVACILERFDAIRSPGGYLRALCEKSAQGTFSPGPMVMALLSNTSERKAS